MEISRNATFVPTDEWYYEPMFKPNANGALMKWRVGFCSPNIVIEHGHVDGAIQRELVEVTLNSSGRNIYEQSQIEINNRYLKKHREGYRAKDEPPPLKGPMLAHKYEHGKTKLDYPVGCTVKLDGIRCLIRKQGDKLQYRSRNNKEYTHLTLFDPSITALFDLLPPGVELDGEMFSEDLTFNQISSVFRKEVNTNNEDLRKYIKYYVFDCNLAMPYEQRWGLLIKSYISMCKTFSGDNMVRVVNTFWAKDHDALMEFHRFSMSKGYEGTMIRALYSSNPTPKGYELSLYKSGRKKNILKLKDIEEEEGEIIGVEEGKGRERGIALMNVKDPRGNVFLVRPAATFETRKVWFDNPETIIGKKMTYHYQNLSETGVPRFAVGKEIRDYE